MTSWHELDDLGVDESLDELDPLAPMSTRAEAARAEEVDEDPFAQPAEFSAELGFTDGDGVVRVFIDDAGVINKVRMSASWRERLAGKPLEQAFISAFIWINNFRNGPAEFVEPDALPDSGQSYNGDATQQIGAQFLELLERKAALGPDEGFGQWSGTEVVGVSSDRSVSVRLDKLGRLAGIEFNQTWLREARIKQISDAVVRAAQDAQAQFVPPVYEPGERDEINRQIRQGRDELLAMMRRGFLG